MAMLRAAAGIGAVTAVVGFTVGMGPPPLDAVRDPVIWIFYGVLAGLGAFWGITMMLAWRTTRRSPRWLFATLLGLLLISLRPVLSFNRESRDTQRFLSTAVPSQGVVINKFVRGGVHLVVEYEARGRRYRVVRTGQNPRVGTQAFRRWKRGDRIPVYYQPAAPQRVRVGVPGPEPRFLIELLAKRWVLWGLLLTAYLPLLAGISRRSAGRPRPGYRLQPARGPTFE
jgi:hypothetical protein